jgi:hypothetical protein
MVEGTQFRLQSSAMMPKPDSGKSGKGSYLTMRDVPVFIFIFFPIEFLELPISFKLTDNSIAVKNNP